MKSVELFIKAGGFDDADVSFTKALAVATQKQKDELNKILATHTKQPLEKIIKDTDRDFFMSAQESKDYGLVDGVIAHFGEAIK